MIIFYVLFATLLVDVANLQKIRRESRFLELQRKYSWKLTNTRTSLRPTTKQFRLSPYQLLVSRKFAPNAKLSAFVRGNMIENRFETQTIKPLQIIEQTTAQLPSTIPVENRINFMASESTVVPPTEQPNFEGKFLEAQPTKQPERIEFSTSSLPQGSSGETLLNFHGLKQPETAEPPAFQIPENLEIREKFSLSRSSHDNFMTGFFGGTERNSITINLIRTLATKKWFTDPRTSVRILSPSFLSLDPESNITTTNAQQDWTQWLKDPSLISVHKRPNSLIHLSEHLNSTSFKLVKFFFESLGDDLLKAAKQPLKRDYLPLQPRKIQTEDIEMLQSFHQKWLTSPKLRAFWRVWYKQNRGLSYAQINSLMTFNSSKPFDDLLSSNPVVMEPKLLNRSLTDSLYQEYGIKNRNSLGVSEQEITSFAKIFRDCDAGSANCPVFNNPLILDPKRGSSPDVLNPLILSPYILSPYIFGPFIISPLILTPQIISPSLLAPTVLSPLVLAPLILSPQLLNPTILSPSVLTPIILSPGLLGPVVLSPSVLSPCILSPTALSPVVLSPSVFSPSQAADGTALCPGVLSDSVDSPGV